MKKFLAFTVALLMVFSLCGCNKQDKYTYAYITFNGKTELVEVEKKECLYGRVVIYATDGRMFTTGYANVLLTNEEWR